MVCKRRKAGSPILFTSWRFAEFFLVVLFGLWLLRRRSGKQLLLLGSSVAFYAASRTAHLLVLAAPAVIDYFCALRIEAAANSRSRKGWLLVSLISNLGLLAYFKYANFFLATFSDLTGLPARHLNIALPVGISFFIFKTLSYTLDVYRGDLKACRSWWRYALFVSFFPELVAGPIVRASIFLPQLQRSLQPSWRRSLAGAQIMLLGLTKKVLVADRLAPFVDAIFQDPSVFAPQTVALAVFAYSLQIFCDFSGYSDMAIGMAKIIGFDLPENFRLPYTATSIADFWRRWHITLSTWLRDYLYIPLGGNRHGIVRTSANLLITMLLGGLWHGASWTFVFWGFLHGSALMVHRLWNPRRGAARSLMGSLAGWLVTFLFVNFAWIFFRARDFETAWTVVRKIAGLAPGGAEWPYSPLLLLLPLVIGAHIIGRLAEARAGQGNSLLARWLAVRRHRISGVYALIARPGFMGAFFLTCWLLFVWLFYAERVNPFIYFRF
jgi:alginate O-acetyltransferase complex protein AlgI